MAVAKKEGEKIESKQKFAIPLYTLLGEEQGLVDVSGAIFNTPINLDVITQYVRVFRTNQRQGNASSKTRAEVAGTTKKMYKQKGTGKARHGSAKAPIFKGGGVVGGPKPKTYQLSLNKKQKKIALFSSLTKRFQDKDILAVTSNEGKIKTKDVMRFIKKLDFVDKKILFILPSVDTSAFVLANRNIQGVQNLFFHSLNAYDALSASKIVFLGDSVSELEKHFLSKE
ncbi:50S ribosomal protein L4 [Candidatus Roizmanbacteria bacterium CG_4_10_14_0_8_um_filter_39_9]|uniref:Large ribosomal subunit protein uL4 n=1 Tax=Candidatus Roizmanbacteria bacterium CG_4_10_14_0_8_um_filter_39_9 TaxID=1974829 RepID=A0A2M7QBY0_9BACT|nr:MAG: 50S ribosomal protein L4 [Candidatus Roizmanbacteria bacterium CG_4_10_14_0_8_um_filter_39_9]